MTETLIAHTSYFPTRACGSKQRCDNPHAGRVAAFRVSRAGARLIERSYSHRPLPKAAPPPRLSRCLFTHPGAARGGAAPPPHWSPNAPPGDVTGRGALPTLSLGGRSAGGGTGLVNNDSSPLGSRLVGAGTSHPKHGLDSHVQMARRQSPRFILHLILHFLSDSVDLQETCHVHDQSTDCAVVQE